MQDKNENIKYMISGQNIEIVKNLKVSMSGLPIKTNNYNYDIYINGSFFIRCTSHKHAKRAAKREATQCTVREKNKPDEYRPKSEFDDSLDF